MMFILFSHAVTDNLKVMTDSITIMYAVIKYKLWFAAVTTCDHAHIFTLSQIRPSCGFTSQTSVKIKPKSTHLLSAILYIQ